MRIHLQRSAPIQPKTSENLPKICQTLAGRPERLSRLRHLLQGPSTDRRAEVSSCILAPRRRRGAARLGGAGAALPEGSVQKRTVTSRSERESERSTHKWRRVLNFLRAKLFGVSGFSMFSLRWLIFSPRRVSSVSYDISILVFS